MEVKVFLLKAFGINELGGNPEVLVGGKAIFFGEKDIEV